MSQTIGIYSAPAFGPSNHEVKPLLFQVSFFDGGRDDSEGVTLEPSRPPSDLDVLKSSGFV